MLTLLDIGSNAVRCLLVEYAPGNGFKVTRESRVQTRLGGGQTGELPATAMTETVVTIRRFLDGVRRETAKSRSFRVVAIATAAVRDAANRDALLDALKQETGVTVRVLSGEEEACFGALAAIDKLEFRNGVVMDLGGGSLQISRIEVGKVRQTSSLPLGALRATRRFFKNDPPTTKELTVLREEVRRLLFPVMPTRQDAGALVGTGGTVRTLAAMHLATLSGSPPSRQGYKLQRHHVTSLRERIAACSAWERRNLPGLKAERADIILAGALVVEEVLLTGGYDALTVCKDGVRHGVLLHEIVHRRGKSP